MIIFCQDANRAGQGNDARPGLYHELGKPWHAQHSRGILRRETALIPCPLPHMPDDTTTSYGYGVFYIRLWLSALDEQGREGAVHHWMPVSQPGVSTSGLSGRARAGEWNLILLTCRNSRTHAGKGGHQPTTALPYASYRDPHMPQRGVSPTKAAGAVYLAWPGLAATLSSNIVIDIECARPQMPNPHPSTSGSSPHPPDQHDFDHRPWTGRCRYASHASHAHVSLLHPS